MRSVARSILSPCAIDVLRQRPRPPPAPPMPARQEGSRLILALPFGIGSVLVEDDGLALVEPLNDFVIGAVGQADGDIRDSCVPSGLITTTVPSTGRPSFGGLPASTIPAAPRPRVVAGAVAAGLGRADRRGADGHEMLGVIAAGGGGGAGKSRHRNRQHIGARYAPPHQAGVTQGTQDTRSTSVSFWTH